MNTTKTIVLMVALTVLLVFLGGALVGRQGIIIAFIFAMAMNMFSYWFSDKIVLRMYNAQEATEGILRLLTREELEGVMAHELSHVRNRDILIGTIAAMLAGAISMIANMAQWAMIFGGGRRDDDERGGGIIGLIAMVIIAPIAAALIQMAISRSREY